VLGNFNCNFRVHFLFSFVARELKKSRKFLKTCGHIGECCNVARYRRCTLAVALVFVLNSQTQIACPQFMVSVCTAEDLGCYEIHSMNCVSTG
jgi:hypothetical protein